MERTGQLQKRVENTCREILDEDHLVTVEAVGGQEPLVFEGSCKPGDKGLISGAPCRQRTDPHGHQRLADVLEGEKPFPEGWTIMVHEADESAMASTGGGHA
jgi:hypothetical protein